jgi:CRISPR-associated endonuclease/helicase Cas3
MGEGVELFDRFFRAVHGTEPFAWQRRLAERVIEGPGWPAAVAVPTGLGKTAAVDVAVVALAAQADRPPRERTAPTRIFVVVDRRLLVDQAFERARRVAAALEAPVDGAVRQVAEALRRIGGGQRPLEVVRMRGGVTWSWRWLPSPTQPAVIAATVDQFGSRLLFRGYGVGERLRPIDAALCGRDSLVLLDEAHLSPAFARTLEAARRLEEGCEQPLLTQRTPRPVLLSATLRLRGTPDESEGSPDEEVVRADPDAETSDEARRRFAASRRLGLCEVDGAGSDGRDRLAAALAGLARRALADFPDSAPRLAVVANTVATARAVFDRLREDLEDRADVELLVGRCRGFERERLGLARRIREAFEAANPPPQRARPAILVATQTIEVGADLDVDWLVTEAAPLDALLQRLGRLNRLGLRERASAVCVFATRLHGDDPVYGDRIARTWEWLRGRIAGEPVGLDPAHPCADGAPSLEVGLGTLRELVGPADLEECAVESVEAPVLVAPHLDAWARTSPAPDPDQPVAPFLHGLDRGAPEVSICWRAPLPTEEAWRAELEALPIGEEERVEVPLWAARRFLRGVGPGDISDLEAVTVGEEGPSDGGVEAVVQHVDGSVERLVDVAALRAGDTVIVDPAAGGHDAWGWTGQPGWTPDVADLVPRGRRALRLRPSVLAWVTAGDASEFRRRLADGEAPLQDLAADLLSQAIARVEARADLDPPLSLWVQHARQMWDALAGGQARVLTPGRGPDGPDPDLGLLVEARGPAQGDRGDESEATTSTAPAPIRLLDHAGDVGRRARDFAGRLGLPEELLRAAELAGVLHDSGKAEHRFQLMLHRGDPDRLEAGGTVLAKSGMDPADRRALVQARQRAGLPAGWRHEAVSLAIARRLLGEHAGVDVQLVQHLVAAHHGCARPVFPPVDGAGRVRLVAFAEPLDGPLAGLEELGDLEVDHVDWDGPLRLLALCRRYGWWGLALLEATVRLADIAVSEEYR